MPLRKSKLAPVLYDTTPHFRVLMMANMKQSYDVTIECRIEGTSIESQNTLDLKNPYFRYTGVQPQPPPGENNQSPSEMYWTQVDLAGARQVSGLPLHPEVEIFSSNPFLLDCNLPQ